MDGRAAGAAAARKRVKRAMGLLRAAAPLLAEAAEEVDVAGELHLDPDELAPAREVELVAELLTIIRARNRRGRLDVVILSAPARKLEP
jgi:hypothetical protein